jgi:hypothetical protein
MTDKELLELAAKAIGLKLQYNYLGGRDANQPWDPLENDGDSLRLAVDLEFDVWIDGDAVEIFFGRDIGAKSLAIEYVGNGDPYVATRRCITMAAAEIGKTK